MLKTQICVTRAQYVNITMQLHVMAMFPSVQYIKKFYTAHKNVWPYEPCTVLRCISLTDGTLYVTKNV